MKLGSLFTGYGGLEMAAGPYFGAETVWCSDIDPGACKIIAHRFPGVPNLGDIARVDWTQVEPIDVLTGGWPCQPFSHAGKRRGAADERALWPEVARAVRALRPRYVFLENVAAIASAGELARAVGDLATLGYVGSWRSLRAADVGAPHGRLRTFILAADARRKYGQRWTPAIARCARVGRSSSEPQRSPEDAVADTQNQRSGGRTEQPGRDSLRPLATSGHAASVADTTGVGRHEGRAEPAGLVGGSDAAERGATPADTERLGRAGRGGVRDVGEAPEDHSREAQQRQRDRDAAHDRGAAPADAESHSRRISDGDLCAAADTDRDGLQGVRRLQPIQRDFDRRGGADIAWGVYEPAIRRWESILRRPAPAPAVISETYLVRRARRLGKRDRRPVGMRGSLAPVRQLSPRFVEFMMGLPEGWVTDVPGLSRNAQLKALGNGVVPQQAAAALRMLTDMEAAA